MLYQVVLCGSSKSWAPIPVASFTKEVNLRLAKRPLVFNGRVANHSSTSLAKDTTVCGWYRSYYHCTKFVLLFFLRAISQKSIQWCIDCSFGGFNTQNITVQGGVLNFLEQVVPTWWHHQMKTFSVLLARCAGNSPVTGESPHKGQWRGALMFSLICDWINSWVNNCEAGDLRYRRAHYDVIVMISIN